MKAVALDLDGTLLNSSHTVSLLAKKTLVELESFGIKVVLASARPIQSVLTIAQSIGLKNEMMIAGNGAIIAQRDHKILYKKSIEKVDLEHIFKIYKEYTAQYANENLTMHIYSEFKWLVPLNSHKAQEEARIIGFLPNIIGEEAYEVKSAEKIMIVSEPLILKQFSKFLTEKLSHLGIVLSKPDSLEINAYGVSKYTGVLEFARINNLSIDNFICIGDGDNDEAMLKNCGFGVAMDNASFAAKNAAKEVTLSNDQDGVAYFLRKYFSLND
ncbi:Cof-type HAD-IIB family hydrolase [Fluviispira sanaruensis]|uniref:Cof-type HAD-IIB family hydrolase n=1 Tax=Fluviispira sanaruensis TaxID=2493639 RepID=A0A4P2VKF7_FLUSA|nr:Cof-type HAD-IIB family hydrolase [Fluviispira sanaruensis]BBH51749.1 Cof-type HAD-IIB family hydrolase [Fluviispira sanaruensis]